MPTPLRPHCEPRHVTPRSASLLNWNEGEQGWEKKPLSCSFAMSCRNSHRAPFNSPELRWNCWKTPRLQQCREWRLFFVSSRLIGSLECNAACDWPRVSCWPKVDSQRVGDAGSEKKEKKNSSYKTTPCASPEWGWNNHREDACTQKYIKLWQRLTILELPRNDFTCSARFYGHNRRRPPAMTPHNYTGNFVLTPAVSMDANRSANSLLPQLVWLLLLPTLQSFTDGVQRSKYARKWLRQPAPSF